MTRQTAAPLTRLPISTFNRGAADLVHEIQRGRIDLNPPYQRGEVWTEDQQRALIFSLLSGLPVPTLIINLRPVTEAVPYAVIDGKQRLTAAKAWFTGELAVPASWFPAAEVAVAVGTDDGPYVTFTGLTERGQGRASRMVLPVGEATLATVQEEAMVYGLVNGGGTPQTEADMANAARIAEAGK